MRNFLMALALVLSFTSAYADDVPKLSDVLKSDCKDANIDDLQSQFLVTDQGSLKSDLDKPETRSWLLMNLKDATVKSIRDENSPFSTQCLDSLYNVATQESYAHWTSEFDKNHCDQKSEDSDVNQKCDEVATQLQSLLDTADSYQKDMDQALNALSNNPEGTVEGSVCPRCDAKEVASSQDVAKVSAQVSDAAANACCSVFRERDGKLSDKQCEELRTGKPTNPDMNCLAKFGRGIWTGIWSQIKSVLSIFTAGFWSGLGTLAAEFVHHPDQALKMLIAGLEKSVGIDSKYSDCLSPSQRDAYVCNVAGNIASQIGMISGGWTGILKLTKFGIGAAGKTAQGARIANLIKESAPVKAVARIPGVKATGRLLKARSDKIVANRAKAKELSAELKGLKGAKRLSAVKKDVEATKVSGEAKSAEVVKEAEAAPQPTEAKAAKYFADRDAKIEAAEKQIVELKTEKRLYQDSVAARTRWKKKTSDIKEKVADLNTKIAAKNQEIKFLKEEKSTLNGEASERFGKDAAELSSTSLRKQVEQAQKELSDLKYERSYEVVKSIKATATDKPKFEANISKYDEMIKSQEAKLAEMKSHQTAIESKVATGADGAHVNEDPFADSNVAPADAEAAAAQPVKKSFIQKWKDGRAEKKAAKQAAREERKAEKAFYKSQPKEVKKQIKQQARADKKAVKARRKELKKDIRKLNRQTIPEHVLPKYPTKNELLKNIDEENKKEDREKKKDSTEENN